jgi:16S rRNA pseudouridine516 synthase
MLRLDRILSSRGYCTRSQAKGFLRHHEVTVNGKRIEKVDTKVDPSLVKIDAEPLDPESLFVLMNKPVGFVCSHREQGELVYQLLPERWNHRNPQVATVGRLDKDTSGLLLFTDDGQLLHRLTSPKHHLPRVYLTTLDRPLRGDEAKIFTSGTMMLEGEEKPLLPAELEVISETLARIALHEGRYHQVRRMFAAVGNHVTALHREKFGEITLGDLGPGEFRLLESPRF